jgi:hypothetical protein
VVGDVFDSDNKMINNLQNHNINPNLFLEWMAICKSIPPSWITAIKDSQPTEEPNHWNAGIFAQDEYISLDKLTQKQVIKTLSSRKQTSNNKFHMTMSEKLGLTPDDWNHLYNNINKWSISTKHRSFSWRLLQGTIFTNKDFARFGFKASAKCSFCDTDPQDREHLLLKCSAINKFRQETFSKFANMFQNKLIDEKLMLFGCLDTGKVKYSNSVACDLLIMLLNKYIYYSNYHENKLSHEGFGNELKTMERIEYDIAERKGKLEIHLTKWEQITTHLGYNILTC